MKKIVVTGGIALAIMVALGSLQGCLGLQRAAGCNNPGILGCKDKGAEMSEITQPPNDLKPAPPGGRPQERSVGDGRYLEGREYPWSQPLDDCMAAGGTRSECFDSLPPDILEQFEAWEAERASQRGRQLQQRSPHPAFGTETSDTTTRE